MLNKSTFSVWIIDHDIISQFGMRIKLRQFMDDLFVTCFDTTHRGLMELTELRNMQAPMPDIIFLDLQMPYMNGWAFLDLMEEILENLTKPDVYIISSFEVFEDFEKARQHHLVKGYFTKPLDKHNLEFVFMRSGIERI